MHLLDLPRWLDQPWFHVPAALILALGGGFIYREMRSYQSRPLSRAAYHRLHHRIVFPLAASYPLALLSRYPFELPCLLIGSLLYSHLRRLRIRDQAELAREGLPPLPAPIPTSLPPLPQLLLIMGAGLLLGNLLFLPVLPQSLPTVLLINLILLGSCGYILIWDQFRKRRNTAQPATGTIQPRERS